MSEVGISLDCNCIAAQWAVQNNLRERRENGYKTCVFDLMLSNYEGIIQCILQDFDGFCDPSNLEFKKYSSYTIEKEIWIYNKKYKFLFNHESPFHGNLHNIEYWPSPSHYT